MSAKYYPINRKPQNEALVPLSIKKPINLKSVIVCANARNRGQVCLQELSLLLACFKQTNYSQIGCATEIGNFQKCFYAAKMGVQQGIKKGKEEPKFSSLNEINELLKKYSVK